MALCGHRGRRFLLVEGNKEKKNQRREEMCVGL